MRQYFFFFKKKAMANNSYRHSVSAENIQKTICTIFCVLGHLLLNAMGGAVVGGDETDHTKSEGIHCAVKLMLFLWVCDLSLCTRFVLIMLMRVTLTP